MTVTKCQAALRTLQGFPYFSPTCLCQEPHRDPECNQIREYLFDHPCGIVNTKGKNVFTCKVENILKRSLDLITSPSPSVKIQIMGGKVCLRCKCKTLLGVVNNLLITKNLLTSPSNVLPQVNFPTNYLNFH